MKILTKEEEREHYKYVAAISYPISSIAMERCTSIALGLGLEIFRLVLSSTTVLPSKAAF